MRFSSKLTLVFFLLLSTPLLHAALVITCPIDKNENYQSNCSFEIEDYTAEVGILESDGLVFINQVQAPGTAISQSTTIQIIVTDEGGNVESCFFDIILPPRPEISFSTTQPFCFGGQDGFISATVTNGQAPYTYLWTTGGTGNSIAGLSAGSYGLTVTDAVGCSVLREVTLSQPSKVTLNLNVSTFAGGHNVSSKDAEDGSASASATGGNPPYAWLWSTGENTTSIQGLGVGEYWVQVTDFNGCVDTASFSLIQPFILNIPVAISPNGDGLNDVFIIDGLEDYPENTLVVFNRWGDIVFRESPYMNSWGGESTADLQIGKNELPDGTYFYHLRVKDQPEVLKGSIIIKRQ